MITKKCIICNKEFKTKPYSFLTNKYCSYACLGISKRGLKVSPETLLKMRLAKKGKLHTPEHRKKIGLAHVGLKRSELAKKNMSEAQLKHSKEIGKRQKGEKNPCWKGGITPVSRQIRQSEKYLEWRTQIFIRDDFTCQKCGERGGKLEAHHVKPFWKILEDIKVNMPLINLYEAAMLYTPLWDLNNGITYCKDCHKHMPRS